MNVGRISNLRQTRFAERICNSLASFAARIGNVAVDRECQDLQPQMVPFTKASFTLCPRLVGWARSCLNCYQCSRSCCQTLSQASGFRHCVSESSRGGTLSPSYNGIISKSEHRLKAEVAFVSAVYPTHRAALLLLSVKLEGTQSDSGLPSCGLECSPTYQPGTLALSFLELLRV